jgi:predicted ATPase/DNA-binding winged helix-turn-helix (wHTH) protein
VDLAAGALRRGGEPIELQPKVYEALLLFLERPGELLTRELLLRALWPDVFVGDESLSQVMSKLRRAVDDDPRAPRYFETVPRRGFRFLGEVRRSASLPEVASPSPTPAAAESTTPPLTSASPSLVGRADELARVMALLGGVAPLISLVGAGGMGKTRLAREVVRLRPAGESCWVDLSEARDEGGVVRALALALEVPLVDSSEAGGAVRVASALRARGGLLVVLDNAEQVVEAVRAQVKAWRAEGSAAAVLVTSRERLGISGEQVVPLGSLPRAQAKALFRMRAAESCGEPPADDAEGGPLSQLVDELDGNPLAIELAAARCTLFTVDELRGRLTERFRVLKSSAHDRPARHSSLWAAIDWSWELLSGWERAALAQLSVVPGRFSAAMAESLLDLSAFADAPWELDAVQALRDKSLVESVSAPGERGTLRLLDSIRAYARQQLDTSGGAAAALGRLAVVAVDVCEPLAQRVRAQPTAAALRELSAWLDVLVPVVDHALAEDADLAARAALCAAAALSRIGPFGLLLNVLDRVLGASSRLEVTQRVRLLVTRAEAVTFSGAAARDVQSTVDAAVDAARALGNAALLSRALTAGARLRYVASRHDAAESLAREAIAVAEGAEAWPEVLEAAATHVRALLALGRLAEARGEGERLAAIAQAMGFEEGWAEVKAALGQVESAFGAQGASERHYEDARDAFRRLGFTRREAMMEANLAMLYGGMRRFTQTGAKYTHAIAMFERLGDRVSEAALYLNASAFHLFAAPESPADLDVAERSAERAGALAQAHGLRHIRIRAALNMGTATWLRGRLPEARARYEEAAQLAAEFESPIDEGLAYCWLGGCLAADGRAEEGRAALERGQQRLGAGAQREEAFCAVLAGFVALAMGNAAEGRAALHTSSPANETLSKVELVKWLLRRQLEGLEAAPRATT